MSPGRVLPYRPRPGLPREPRVNHRPTEVIAGPVVEVLAINEQNHPNRAGRSWDRRSHGRKR